MEQLTSAVKRSRAGIALASASGGGDLTVVYADRGIELRALGCDNHIQSRHDRSHVGRVHIVGNDLLQQPDRYLVGAKRQLEPDDSKLRVVVAC